MIARSRPARVLGTALALALLLGAAPLRADQGSAESIESAESAVQTPAPEPAVAEPLVEPAAAGEPSLVDEPIEAVHRPKGFWGPVAVAADLLVMRPIGLLSLVGGAAAFVAIAPVAAATCTLGDRVDTLGDRARNVFTRPLGAL